MNILRQLPFPLTVSYSGLVPNDEYIMQIYDDHNVLVISYDVTADGSGNVEQELGLDFTKYDATYSLYIYTLDVNGDPDEIGLIDTLYIYRPYYNPLELAPTEGEQEEYILLERTARQVIDVITGGFYYQTGTEELIGNGADVLPVSRKIVKLNYLYENNVLAYDRFNNASGNYTYYVTPDFSGITRYVGQEFNRSQWKDVRLPIGSSDSFQLLGDDYDSVNLVSYRGGSFFPENYDYVVYGEFGWPVVPQDIKDATKMLINDIKCNKFSYINRYIKEYETDQFTIKYADLAHKATGNLMVDRILSNYTSPIWKLGVL